MKTLLFVVGVLFSLHLTTLAVPLSTDFKPEEVAAAEVRMWKAYYARNAAALTAELKTALERQFNLPPEKADVVAGPLSQAAMLFITAGGDYEKTVLPTLLVGYTKLKEALDGSFDPSRVASAELAWWVARRNPQTASPKQVGRLIAVLYQELYGSTNEEIQRAGVLRAEAAYQRDLGALRGKPDWTAIEKTLQDSYRALHDGLKK